MSDLVSRAAADGETISIFPSEVAAAFWRRKVLDLADQPAVLSSRFLSWDRFKELYLSMNRPERPVNRLIRLCFVHDYLGSADTSGSPLPGIIPSGFSGTVSGFAEYISRLLPSLVSFPDAAEGLSRIDPPLHAGLARLFHTYTAFLREKGMFEPAFDVSEPVVREERVTVFFPDLIEDYPLILPRISGWSGLKTVSVPDIESHSSAEYLQFENSYEEAAWITSRIVRLLTDGTAPSDIVITAADSGSVDYLTDAASLCGLPLDFRSGRKLTEYPAGAFFNQLSDSVHSGFHVDQLKTLLTGAAVPWRERRLHERIVSRLAETYAVVNELPGKPGEKRLVRALRSAGEEHAAEYLSTLMTRMSAVCTASGYGDLREKLIRFSGAYFTDDHWDETGRKVFQYAVDRLTSIGSSLESVDVPKGLSAYTLFLFELKNSIYVHRSAPGGIPVYDYRVTAGIQPPCHFIAGVSQESTKVTASSLDFLRTDQKVKLGLEDRDFSSCFLDAYAFSGDNVAVTSAGMTDRGKTLIPGVLLTRFTEGSRDWDVPGAGTYLRENRSWQGIDELPSILFPLQCAGFSAAEGLELFTQQEDNHPISLGNSRILEKVLGNIRREERVGFSPTSLELFRSCPFAYLLTYGMGIPEQYFMTLYSSPAAAGMFAHDTAKLLYREIQSQDGSFRSSHRDDYRNMIDSIIPKLFGSFSAKGFLFLPPVWDTIMSDTAGWTESLLDLESRVLGDLPVLETEKRYSVEPESAGLYLHGKIDRISGTPDDAVIIDYKKKNRTRKEDVEGSGDEPPVSFQIPFYVYLCRENGISVRRAGYVDFEKGKYVPVLESDGSGKEWFSPEEMERAVETMLQYVLESYRKIETGDFSAAGPGCDPCRFRGVCRVKYSVH